MKKTFFLAFGLFIALVACNSNGDQQADKTDVEEDSVVINKQEDAFPSENLAIINETGFSKYARLSLPELNWSKFTVTKFWNEDFHHKTAFNPDKNYFNSYGQFLKYSPDSSKFIDLDSYNISISRNKKGQLVGESQEPDTEISLVDLKTKEKTQLIFLGPGNSVEDGAWIDNDNLILIGYSENDSASGTNAAIWQFNLATRNVNQYEMSDPEVLKKLKNYTERERLKNVIIK